MIIEALEEMRGETKEATDEAGGRRGNLERRTGRAVADSDRGGGMIRTPQGVGLCSRGRSWIRELVEKRVPKWKGTVQSTNTPVLRLTSKAGLLSYIWKQLEKADPH